MLPPVAASNAVPPQPRRVKTSPTLHTIYTSKNRETDRQHAVRAAHIAYERWNSRAHVDPLAASQSVWGSSPQSQYMKHPRSIRFSGRDACPDKFRPITRREASSPILDSSEGLQEPLVEAKYATRLIDEDFGEAPIASLPSSYRRISKTKSWFSSSHSSSPLFANKVPGAGRHFQRHSQYSSSGSNEPCKSRDTNLKRYDLWGSRRSEAHDAAIQMAQDSYLRQLDQQRMKKQRSFLKLGRFCSTRKAFKRSVRSNSTNSCGHRTRSSTRSGDIEERTRRESADEKARSLSEILRVKIARAFKGHPPEQTDLPAQQLSATHIHYDKSTLSFDNSDERFSLEFKKGRDLLQQMRSSNSFEEARSISGQSIAHREGSIHSAPSDDEQNQDRSRVTSWTDSTITNCMVTPQVMERKRLSVIKEDGGPHQPSSDHSYSGIDNGYAIFREPLVQTKLSKEEMELLASEVQNNKGSFPQDNDSYNLGSEAGRAPKAFHANELATATDSIRQCSSRNANAEVIKLDLEKSKSWEAQPRLVQNLERTKSNEQHSQPAAWTDLTPQQIASLNECNESPNKRPLREVKSAFFPPSRYDERNRTPSPFRRLMQSRSRDLKGFRKSSLHQNRSMEADSLILLKARQHSGSIIASESAYSQSTGDLNGQNLGSSASLVDSQLSDEAGHATRVYGCSSKHDYPAHSSASSSGDWKGFMTSQMVALETRTSSNGRLNFSPAKRIGHRREKAQIDGDDLHSDSFRTYDNRYHQKVDSDAKPTGVPPNTPGEASTEKSVGSWPVLSPSAHIASISANNRSQSENMGGSRRSTLVNKENENRSGGRNQIFPIKPGVITGYHTSYASVSPPQTWKSKKQHPSPRDSPERTERLRRLNNSATSLRKPLSARENQIPFATNAQQLAGESAITPRAEGIRDKQAMEALSRGSDYQIKKGVDGDNDSAFI